MRPEGPSPDPAFIEKLRARDETAYKQLYEIYAEKVFNLCYRFLGTRTEAEDALQEVICKVLASIGRFRQDAQLSSWIYRIAVNHCLNMQRSRRRTRWFSLDALLEDNQEKWPAEGVSPHEQLEQDEAERLVQEAINKLSENQRTVLLLNRYEGLSYQEIARVLGCSVAAVESRLHQAKKNLSRQLSAHFGRK
jgi:RNA polymerase sigma-70 factor, ECF subfamily